MGFNVARDYRAIKAAVKVNRRLQREQRADNTNREHSTFNIQRPTPNLKSDCGAV